MNSSNLPTQVLKPFAPCFLTWLLAASTVSAATIPVSTTSDAGPGSLRAALATTANGDTITFSLPMPAIIPLANGELLITNDVIIAGPGATNLAISGNTNSRVFNIATNHNVGFSGLTIRDGRASGSSDVVRSTMPALSP